MNERPRQYATAAAFRVALETRLKSVAAADGVDLQRLRRQVSFDRLLARFFVEPNAPWLLKGGYAMELRLRTARTTKDIDISLPADLAAGFAGEILARLQQSARADLGDFFGFTIAEPTMNLDAAPQGGARYPVTTMLAGRVFTRFQLDIGIGDAVVPPTELIEGRDWLGFAGIAPGRFMVISKEQQFAEKLHAYTVPRSDTPNSRVKDLVDMILLIQMGTMDRTILERAIRTTFELRGTHTAPTVLPNPPQSWTSSFDTMAKECGIELKLSDAVQMLTAYLQR